MTTGRLGPPSGRCPGPLPDTTPDICHGALNCAMKETPVQTRRFLMSVPAIAILGATVLPPAALGSPGSGFSAPVLVTADLDHQLCLS